MSVMKRDTARICLTRTSRDPIPATRPTRDPDPPNAEYSVTDPGINQLSDWLMKMGCPLENTELKSLNSVSMRPIWSHITQYVRPAHEVQLIRKNLLLARLKRQSDQTIQQTTGFRVQSVTQLKQLQNIVEIQQRISEAQDEMKEVDQLLQSEIKTHLFLKSEIEYTRECLEEVEMKTALLQLNLHKVSSYSNELDKKIGQINELTVDIKPKTFQEKKQNIIAVMDVLAKSEPSPFDLNNKHEIKKIVQNTHKYTADVIYYAICLASRKLYDSLRRYKTNLNISDSNKSLYKYLREFRTKIVNSELEHQTFFNVLKEELVALDIEKESLARVLDEICEENNISLENEYGENVTPMEYLNALVDNTIYKRKSEKIQEFIRILEKECSEFENLKQLANSLGEKEINLNKEAEKRVEEMGELYYSINNSNNESDLKNEILKTCAEQVSKFFTENKSTNYANEDIFGASEDLVWKEIEVFINIPLIALTRDWEEPSYTMVHSNLMHDIVKKPEGLALLLHSDPVNFIKNVIEKKYWSQALAEHYNAR